MGHIRVSLTISNPNNGDLTATVEALVDTGATFTVIPRPLADSLQLPEMGTRRVKTATHEVELRRTFALLEIDGKSEINPVLVSETLDQTLLGVFTLETLALSVDPVSGQLKEADLLLYYDEGGPI